MAQLAEHSQNMTPNSGGRCMRRTAHFFWFERYIEEGGRKRSGVQAFTCACFGPAGDSRRELEAENVGFSANWAPFPQNMGPFPHFGSRTDDNWEESWRPRINKM